MMLPWNNHLDRASPRQWLIRQLAGDETVVINARFGVALLDDGALSTLENFDEHGSLVQNVRGLGIPGHGRLAE